MGLSCGMKCLKFMLFAFNFIIWVCGIAVLGVGIYSRIKVGDWDSIIDDSTIPNAANLMIAAGCFVMVIGFLGCCGAWRENKCLLISYAITLILIFVLEIAAGIYAYTKKDDVLASLKSGLQKAVDKSYSEDTKADEALRKAVDWFQENIKCCGADTPSEWATSAWYKEQNKTTTHVPKSCCVDQTVANCNVGVNIAALISANKIHPKGCVAEGETYVKDHLFEIGGVGVGIAFVQFLGILFAILLCRALNYEKV